MGCPNGTKPVNGGNGTVDCVAIVEPKAEAKVENTTEAPKVAPTTETVEDEKPAAEEEEMQETSINAEMKLNVDFSFVQKNQAVFVDGFVDDQSKSLNVSKDKVLVTGIESGSVLVKFTLLNNAAKDEKGESIPPAVLIRDLQQKAEDNAIKFSAVEVLTKKPVVSQVTKAEVIEAPAKVPCRNCPQAVNIN